MVGIIYKYTSPSNKIYIGQTIHEHTRYMRHKRTEGDNKFHRAIKKYGFEKFTYEVIFTIDNDDRKCLLLLKIDREILKDILLKITN